MITRRPSFIDGPPDADARLAGARLAQVGLGSIGLEGALKLARLGVARRGRGRLDLVDPGYLEAPNLETHPIGPEDLGQPKVALAARRATAIAPDLDCATFEEPFEARPLSALLGVDLVLLASDHPAVEIEVGQACTLLGIPLLHAAVHGDTLVAQVRSFTNADPEGPCPACAFGEAEWDLVASAERFRCDGGGIVAAEGQPTRSTAFLCSLAADLALIEVVRHLLGLGSLSDRLIEYCGYTHRSVLSPLTRNADCPCEHRRLEALEPADPATATLAALADAAHLDPERSSVAIEGLRFAARGACEDPGCPSAGRFHGEDAATPTCAACAGPARPHPLHTWSEAPLARLGAALEAPLATLGVRAPRTLLLRGGTGGACVPLVTPSKEPSEEPSKEIDA